MNDIFEDIFHPKSVAVVGASNNESSWGYSYMHHLINYGFQGKIYPVNPKYGEVLGIKAYPRIKDIPGNVDYVISCIQASGVLKMLDDCATRGVKCVHLYTARFRETGRKDAAQLEARILEKAQEYNIRLIGPNCMGVYCPGSGLSFGYNLPRESGSIGMASQSGGAASGFVHLASLRGVRFSKVVSYGNALDFNECDYLDYFTHDTKTNVILMYVEGVRDGQRFFQTLRRAAAVKPVIVIKGGRGDAGRRAIASHTASMAGSLGVWETAVKQAGAIAARDFDEMADLAVSFYFLPPVKGRRVGVLGGGGGPSVLAAEACEEADLDVIALPAEMREQMKAKGITIWDWVGNPTDISILGGSGLSNTGMLHMMAEHPDFDILIANMNEGVLITLATKERLEFSLKHEVENYREVKNRYSKPLLAVFGDKGPGINDYDEWTLNLFRETRTNLIDAGIPFYPTISRAAMAVSKVLAYYSQSRD